VAAPDVRDAVADAQDAARASHENVRRVAQQLRPPALDLGLPQAIAALCTAMDGGAGFRVDYRVDADLPAMDALVDLVIYRVGQESLTNAARHSGSDRVAVELARRGRALELSVRDHGSGAETAEAGTGIRGMRERAELIGAELRLEPTPGGGTTVRLSVPVPET
jgi:two-component system sensor histidine kinase UhpB